LIGIAGSYFFTMENKSHALAAGFFVLIVSALVIALAAWLIRDVKDTTTYELATQQAVNGLQEQAAVRYKGVTVGKVSRIRLDPTNPGLVVITLAVLTTAPVTRATYATLDFQGVTGLSFIQLDDDGKAAGPLASPLEPGPDGAAPRIPLRTGLLGELSEQARTLVTQLNITAEHFNKLLSDNQDLAISPMLTSVNDAAKSISTIANVLEANVKPLATQTTTSLKTLNGTLQRANTVIVKLDGLTGQVQKGVARVVGPRGTIDKVTESATIVTNVTLPRVNRLAEDVMSVTLPRVNRLAEDVTSVTLPRVNRLTEDVTRAVQRIDQTTTSLSENPQALIYGNAPIPPGPGEPGYVTPQVAPLTQPAVTSSEKSM
jgi:phospholipid/cholesterol/gamma-HCH transport system substrate-binding protein